MDIIIPHTVFSRRFQPLEKRERTRSLQRVQKSLERQRLTTSPLTRQERMKKVKNKRGFSCLLKLLNLFHAKGGTMGLSLQAILLKAPTNPNSNLTRDVVIRCLIVYLEESLDHVLKRYDDADEDSVSQDLTVQRMKIYSIKTNTSDCPDDVGIVVEGMKVLAALGNFPRACSMLLGLTYAVNVANPKELRYTFEVFQKFLLELDCSKLSPKVNSLKNKTASLGKWALAK
ncbi:hypothetical protein COCON_G00128180 [Conger conger]|uniref:Uncharacterized protein n=1 Tax=Conger conger TaxID=82655 RepID=A0A9Q1DDG3_CONCO|nr:hypothetical protein COCON_G00128180 [Conger conger]